MRTRGLLLVCLAGVVWGTIGPAVQVVHDRSGLSPFTIGAYRAAAAVLVLVVAAVGVGRLRECLDEGLRHWRRITAAGLFTAGFQLLFFVAVLWAGVSVGTMVCLGFAPVLLLVLGSVQRRRPPSASQVSTVVLAVTGLLLVSLAGGAHIEAPHPALGLLAAVGSGTCYALSTETSAPLSRRLDTLTMTTTTTLVVGAALIPAGLIVGHAHLVTADVTSWLLIGYLGAVTLALGYALLFTGLRTTPSGAAVVATLLEPVTAVLIAVVFLGERLTVAGVVGALMIGVAIGSLGRKQEPAPQ
ncbi:DMT family transporter [Labedaea rhizosphaerae]|uniref:DME family drug/metabolite transporter n=1 Tax=Labedaea rhizosphaerae TaxID=598644 RepID=A0A4R6SHF3_LABRH|nr:DMT family transporter [Labedaea rhizosphaerae]TDQ00970.1 DME family drug/metabolite transporter [Labedaea rhizosphaerae]